MQIHTTHRYRYYSAILAFIIWGAWAFYVNGDAGFNTRLTSGLAQGTASLIITLVMVRAVTEIYNRLPDKPWRPLLPAVLTVCVTGSVLVLVHTLVGTPRILPTIAPALSVAFAFCIFTALKLNRTQVEPHNDNKG